MSWGDLLELTAGHAWRSEVLLDCAVHALMGSDCAALEAAVVAETPTLPQLCALLDACGVGVPAHLALSPWRSTQTSVPAPRASAAESPLPVLTPRPIA